ncbi:MAG: hypothetical protein JRI72_00520 [Deltaproteobacteria bacterium]|nr:hypothetical protein [Deltaproteobacteria bacterium]
MKAMWPGVKAWFGVGYGEHPEEYKDLFETFSSEQAWEEDVQLKGFGLMPIKEQGKPTTYTGQVQGYVSRYVHVAYSLGFIVTFEERLNNLYKKVASSRAKALGFSKRQTKENVAANVYNRAHTAGYTGGDGKTLCATDHPSAIGDQSNKLDPAADISEAALEDMWIMIAGMTDDAGLKIGLMPRSVHVHRSDWFEANRILKSTLQNDTANNATNVLRSTNAFPDGIKLNHYFSDSDAFFIRTNCPDSMKHYQRYSFDLKQDNDHDTQNLKAFTYDYYSFGWSDYRGVVSNGGGA